MERIAFWTLLTVQCIGIQTIVRQKHKKLEIEFTVVSF